MNEELISTTNSILLRIFAFILSTLITVSIIPSFARIAKRLNLIDIPNDRKQHTFPIVRVGGLSIIIGFLSSLFIYSVFCNIYHINISNFPIIFKCLICILLCSSIGLLDDIYSLSPYVRLVSQIMISIFLWYQGIGIYAINLSFLNIDSYYYLPEFLSFIFTVLWIAGLTNCFNWIDGLDGLASGISTISALTFMLISFLYQNTELGIIFCCLAGSSFGFLRYNFFPAKLFMGDCGSYFLGFSFAVFSLVLNINTEENLNIFIPFFVLSLPILDMISVIRLRINNGLSPFYPDRSHFHHRLIDSGINQRSTVFILFSLVLSIDLIVLFSLNIIEIFPTFIFLIFFMIYIIFTLRKSSFNFF